MFAITKDGVYLDLSGTTLRWETVNTLFEEDALQNDYSFPATLPLSPPNMKAFGFINEADVPKEKVIFDIVLFLDDRSIPSKLIINGIRRSGFNINIAGGFAGLVNADLTLKEALADEDVIAIADVTDLTAFRYADWKNKIAFPAHYNPDFYGDTNPDFNGVLNKQDSVTGDYLTNSVLLGNQYALVPFLYYHYIFQQIFAANGMTIKGNYWYDVEASNLLLYNNYALDAPDTGTTSSFVKAAGTQIMMSVSEQKILFSDLLPDASDPDLAWDNTTSTYTVPTSDEYSFSMELGVQLLAITSSYLDAVGRLAVPVFFVKMYRDDGVNPLEQIGYTSCYGTAARIIINASAACTAGDIVSVKAYVGATFIANGIYRVANGSLLAGLTNPAIYNGMANEVVLGNHVPDITVNDFLKFIKNRAELDFKLDWENKEVTINYAKDIMESPPEVDLTSLSDPYPEQIFEPKKGFTLSYDFGSQDELLTDNFLPYDESRIIGYFPSRFNFGYPAFEGDLAVDYRSCKIWKVVRLGVSLAWIIHSDFYYPIVVGKGEVERKIELAPMFMTVLAPGMLALIPTIRETGCSPMFNLGVDNAPSLRVIYMRGVYHESLGGTQVYASSTNYDYAAQQDGNYTMKLQGTDGWYTLFKEKIMIAIDNGEIFEYKIMLPLSYLAYRGKVQIKNVNYLVKNISTGISKVVKQSVVKLLKLP